MAARARPRRGHLGVSMFRASMALRIMPVDVHRRAVFIEEACCRCGVEVITWRLEALVHVIVS